jgi:hypothetical protein
MKIFTVMWRVILLASLLAVAGCPEVAKQPDSAAGQSDESGRGRVPD